jgi:2-polyprenyl-3-methyl-5-hydroxy-6-metoxy-1,4-benzoquinol methylase
MYTQGGEARLRGGVAPPHRQESLCHAWNCSVPTGDGPRWRVRRMGRPVAAGRGARTHGPRRPPLTRVAFISCQLLNMKCYLCNHADLVVRKGSVRDEPALQILECTNCGLVALSSLKHIEAGHYEDSGMHGDDLPSIETWLREAEHDDQRRFEMLKPALANRRVLDFGCGAAGFVRKAQSLAAEVAGVEPERRVREYWADTMALYGNLEDAGGSYDLITAFHVVEHLPDPRSMLGDLAARLNDRGRLVIEVPSSEDALLTLYDSGAFQRFTYWSQHLFLFNAETLRRLVRQAKLRVVSIQQFQRYPLSNHLYWLSRGQAGGHKQWSFLDTPALTEAYAAALAALGKSDTLIAYLERDQV